MANPAAPAPLSLRRASRVLLRCQNAGCQERILFRDNDTDDWVLLSRGALKLADGGISGVCKHCGEAFFAKYPV